MGANRLVLRREDYREAPEWTGRLFQQLNGWTGPVTDAIGQQNVVWRSSRVLIPDETWTALTLENSWVENAAGQAPRYRITPDAVVHLEGGLVKNGASATIGTFPAGYRPGKVLYLPAVTDPDTFGVLEIRTDGVIRQQAGNTTYFALGNRSWTATSPAAPKPFSGAGWPLVLAAGRQVAHVSTAIRDASSGTAISWGAGAPAWELDGKGNVVIRRLNGLTPGRTYDVLWRLETR